MEVGYLLGCRQARTCTADAICIPQREEAAELVKDAISAGIFNDLGSGSNVDVCIITKDGVDYRRGYDKPNERGVKEQSYKFAKGTTGGFCPYFVDHM